MSIFYNYKNLQNLNLKNLLISFKINDGSLNANFLILL